MRLTTDTELGQPNRHGVGHTYSVVIGIYTQLGRGRHKTIEGQGTCLAYEKTSRGYKFPVCVSLGLAVSLFGTFH